MFWLYFLYYQKQRYLGEEAETGYDLFCIFHSFPFFYNCKKICHWLMNPFNYVSQSEKMIHLGICSRLSICVSVTKAIFWSLNSNTLVLRVSHWTGDLALWHKCLSGKREVFSLIPSTKKKVSHWELGQQGRGLNEWDPCAMTRPQRTSSPSSHHVRMPGDGSNLQLRKRPSGEPLDCTLISDLQPPDSQEISVDRLSYSTYKTSFQQPGQRQYQNKNPQFSVWWGKITILDKLNWGFLIGN